MSRTQITLHGDRSELFRDIRDDLEEEFGYRPSRPEVVGYLMADYDLSPKRRKP
jgi:hypothetical protein